MGQSRSSKYNGLFFAAKIGLSCATVTILVIAQLTSIFRCSRLNGVHCSLLYCIKYMRFQGEFISMSREAISNRIARPTENAQG